MHTSSIVLLCYGAIPELDEASIRPTRDPPPERAGDWGGGGSALGAGSRPHRCGHDRHRGAPAVRRGARSRNGTGLIGGHPGAGKVQEAIGELDLAIRDVRNVVFDRRQPDPLSGGHPG